MASNNAVTTLAKINDVVTLTIITDENVAAPVVTISGKAATTVAGADAQHWTATRTMDGTETEGALAFTLNFDDLSGNSATEVTAVTGGSAVTFDKTAPVVSAATISTNGLKKIGDTIALTITSDATGYALHAVTVNGVAVTGFTDNADNTYSATYTVAEGNSNRGSGATPISVVIKDSAGNLSTAFTAVTANTISIDASVPLVSSATVGSDPAGPGVSTVTIVFNETMDTTTVPVVRITGLATNPYTVTQSSYTGTTWVGTFTVLDNNEAATATIAVSGAKDPAGNTMVANNTAGTFGVDTIAPVVSNVNVDKTSYRATLDPAVVVTVIENNTANTVTVNGFSATETATPGTWTYSLTHSGVVGRYSLSIEATDVTGNSIQYLATSYDVVADTDATAPSLSSISVTPAQSTASVAFTSNEAGNAKVGYGLTSTHGNMTSYSPMTSGANSIVLTGLTCGTTYHYSVYGKDSSNNESISADTTFTTSACTEPTDISVTNTSLVKRVATKNGVFADGWKWVLDVTAPTASTTLAMSFDNFTGAGTIFAADNIRFYSSESSDHNATSSAITITASGAGTNWSHAMTLNSDLSSNPGRQIQIIIEAAVPSESADGAYSASYDIQ